MTVNRTTLLDLPIITTGTESGLWGDYTNNGLTQYVDIAIAGMSNLTSVNFTAGALTIETTEGTNSATNIVATSAQYAGFRVSSLAQASTITVGNTGTNPGRSYRLINADSTYALTFKATGQTGITLQPGQSAVVAFNGTDYVVVGAIGPLKTINCTSLSGPGNVSAVTSVATSNGPAPINGLTLTGGPITSTGTVTLGGGVNVSTITTGTLPVARGGTGLSCVGTSGNVLTSNGTAWVSQAAGGGSNTQTFSATGTYTKPPTANFVYVELWGAGGGGTGGYTAVPISVGRGGGGGGYTHRLFTAPQVGATVTVTIGAGGSGGANTNCAPVTPTNGGDGGNTTFGTLLTAGGGGGGKNPSTPSTACGIPGRGGAAYGFSFNPFVCNANRNIYQSFGGYQFPTPTGSWPSSMFGVSPNVPSGNYFGVYAGGAGAPFNGDNSGGISWFGGGGGALYTACVSEGGAGRLFGRPSVPGSFPPSGAGTGGNNTAPAGNFDGGAKSPAIAAGYAGGLAAGGSAGRNCPRQNGGAGGNGYAVVVSW